MRMAITTYEAVGVHTQETSIGGLDEGSLLSKTYINDTGILDFDSKAYISCSYHGTSLPPNITSHLRGCSVFEVDEQTCEEQFADALPDLVEVYRRPVGAPQESASDACKVDA